MSDRNYLPEGRIPRTDENNRPFYPDMSGEKPLKIYLDSNESAEMEDDSFIDTAKWLMEEDYAKYGVIKKPKSKMSLIPDAPRKTDVKILFPDTLGYEEHGPDDYRLAEIVKDTPTLIPAEIVRMAQEMFIVREDDTWYIYNRHTQVYEEKSEETILTTVTSILRRVPEAPFPIKQSPAKDLMFAIRTNTTLFELSQLCMAKNPALAQKIYDEYTGNLIPFQNCIYNVNEDRILPYTPYKFIKTKFDAIYDPAVTEHPVEKIYRGIIPDEDTLSFFFEFVGYTMFHYEMDPPVIFLMYGPTNTGKSALAETVQKAIGIENVSNLNLTQLSSQFEPAELIGKRMNLATETGDGGNRGRFGGRVDGEFLKQLSDGSRVTFSRKHTTPVVARNTAKMWFVSNSMPDFGDYSSAMNRRLCIVPCRQDQVFEDRIYNKLQERDAISWLINQALDGYKRFLKRGGVFAQSEQMKAEHRRFKKQDGLYEFLTDYLGVHEKGDIRNALDEMEVKETFIEYTAYITDAGGRSLKRGNFAEKICNEYRMKVETTRITKPDGKPTNRQVFVKEGI